MPSPGVASRPMIGQYLCHMTTLDQGELSLQNTNNKSNKTIFHISTRCNEGQMISIWRNWENQWNKKFALSLNKGSHKKLANFGHCPNHGGGGLSKHQHFTSMNVWTYFLWGVGSDPLSKVVFEKKFFLLSKNPWSFFYKFFWKTSLIEQFREFIMLETMWNTYVALLVYINKESFSLKSL